MVLCEVYMPYNATQVAVTAGSTTGYVIDKSNVLQPLTGDVTTSGAVATVAAVNGVPVSAAQAAWLKPASALYLSTTFG